ncbi:MAG: ABC transporter permease [Streptosporangiaceae bacterium]
MPAAFSSPPRSATRSASCSLTAARSPSASACPSSCSSPRASATGTPRPPPSPARPPSASPSRATPLPRWCYFLGRIIATLAVGTLAGTVTVAVGVCFYHVRLSAGAALVILVVFALGAAAWAASATALSSAIPTVEAAFPILVLIYFPVLIVSGLLGSISEPRWLTTLASYLPVRPLADAVTGALGHAGGTPLFPAHDILTLAAWAAAGLTAAIITFRWEPHRPARQRAARATPARNESRGPAAHLALATQRQESSQPAAR